MRNYLSVLLIVSSCCASLAQAQAPPTDAQERVRRAAEKALDELVPSIDSHLEVRINRLRNVPAADSPLRIRFTESDDIPRAHTRAELLTSADGSSWHKTGWALLYVSHYDSVMVSQHGVNTGERLMPDDVVPAWMETTRMSGIPLTPAEFRRLHAQEQAVASRSIAEGAILQQDMLRAPFAAQAGDMLLMVYARGPVRAQLRCRARQSGQPGDIVRLSCRSTGSTYRARLTRTGRAQWVETVR